ncbi:hypothetical protein C7S17_5073 [Burkholderia thailandensis]|nr:hypothetical protein [Burkholderia thailandensis]
MSNARSRGLRRSAAHHAWRGGPHAARAPLIVDIKTPAHGDAMRRCSAGCRSFTAVRVAGLMEAAGPAGAADDSRPASSLAAGRCSERRP